MRDISVSAPPRAASLGLGAGVLALILSGLALAMSVAGRLDLDGAATLAALVLVAVASVARPYAPPPLVTLMCLVGGGLACAAAIVSGLAQAPNSEAEMVRQHDLAVALGTLASAVALYPAMRARIADGAAAAALLAAIFAACAYAVHLPLAPGLGSAIALLALSIAALTRSDRATESVSELHDAASVATREHQRALRQAEAESVESQGRYRALVDGIDAGFCVVEMLFADDGRATDYRIVEVNAAFETATGLADAPGRSMREIAPNHEQYWFDIYGEVATRGVARRFEKPAEAFAGRWYDVHAFPIADPTRPLVGILFNDVTERRQAEIALREMNTTLEQRVELEIANRERARSALHQSQKMEAIGKLTGGVAHDFNNLLTPILGNLDLLAQRDPVTDRETRLLQGALQAAARAKTLVQRLLTFARQQPLQTRSLDIGALVESMGGMVSSTLGPQVRVALEVAEDLPPAMADANQLEMAILNLCMNARDAMPRGGTLTISAVAEPLPDALAGDLPRGTYLRLSVADTGIGMDDDTLRRATEPFYSSKGMGNASGLGLSMVHGLAEQLGGAFDIRSELGVGTTVELWLPLSPYAVAVDTEAGPDRLEHRGRALVVDDEPAVRMTTSEMLQDLGYDTVGAASAQEARALLVKGEQFDLLVTDHLMPGMKGADLARAVQIAWPKVPVLLVTGYAEAKEIAPEVARLNKPFRRDELARAIGDLLADPA